MYETTFSLDLSSKVIQFHHLNCQFLILITFSKSSEVWNQKKMFLYSKENCIQMKHPFPSHINFRSSDKLNTFLISAVENKISFISLFYVKTTELRSKMKYLVSENKDQMLKAQHFRLEFLDIFCFEYVILFSMKIPNLGMVNMDDAILNFCCHFF